MPLILGAQSAAAAAEDNSCRFNGADGAFMTKAQGTPTSRRTYTMSVWFKLSLPSPPVALAYSDRTLFSAGSSSSNIHEIFIANDSAAGNDFSMRFTLNNAADYTMATSRTLRDVGAWYHMVAAVDTTQATDSNRVKLYINGVQETSFSYGPNYPTQDYDVPSIASGQNIGMGARMLDDTRFMDGYMAEAVFIDGLALAPTSFGEFDSDSPTIWKPIDVSGLTFGTNGFYLDFEDSANLGNDANGGTDLTETNLAAVDQSQDSPLNNFATLNPLANYYPASTFTEGSTRIVTGAAAYSWNMSTLGVSAGKWYFEAYLEAAASGGNIFGISPGSPIANDKDIGGVLNGYGYFNDGIIRTNGTDDVTGLATYTTGDYVGCAFDLDNNKIYFHKAGTYINSGNPSAGTGGYTIVAADSQTFSNKANFYFASAGDYDGTNAATWDVNFGNGSFGATAAGATNADANGYGIFKYSVPTGYLALCTKNLGSDGG
jgi:hypothetical protein